MQQHFLNNEDAILKELEKVYGQALTDINSKIADLTAKADEITQSIVYQVEYQKALKTQINGILDDLNGKQFTSVAEYLSQSYEDGFVGTMFDLHGQGIPLIFPIDQEAVVRAVQTDSKISQGLYTRMGEDVKVLKKNITAEITRGIANGSRYDQIAQQISFKMTGTYDTKGGAMGRAMTIARTEGHRIQVQGGFDACYKAKEKGADVLKQWDSTMDSSTRPSHQKVDGEIRELDETFSNGLLYPSDPSGGAKEVVNCRCALLQRARWALDEAELKTLQEKAEFYGLDKTDNFEDFKKKYLNASTDNTTYYWSEANTPTEKTVLKEIHNFYNEVSAKYGIKMDILGDKLADAQADWDMALKMNVSEYRKAHPKVSEKRAESIVQKTMMQPRPVKADISVMEGGQYWHDGSRIVEKDGVYSFERIKKIIVNQNASDFPMTIQESEAKIAERFARIEKRRARGSGRLYLSNATEGGAGTFLHEYGHAIDFTKGIAEHPKFREWYDTLSEDDICLGLSSYAATNANEFIAEAFAESFFSYQRPMSKKFISILDDILKGG